MAKNVSILLISKSTKVPKFTITSTGIWKQLSSLINLFCVQNLGDKLHSSATNPAFYLFALVVIPKWMYVSNSQSNTEKEEYTTHHEIT